MKIFSIIIFFMIGLFTLTEAGRKEPTFIPIPEKYEALKGKFSLSQKTLLVNSQSSLGKYFLSQIQKFARVNLSTNSGNYSNKILLRINNQLNESNKEAYSLIITNQYVEITGASEEGLFRGMQTLFQMIPPSVKSKTKNSIVDLPCCKIFDKPKFSWRGLNLDCARHFMTKDFIKRYIDILAYYKFNILHWHLTDDQGWRIEIKKYPKLTQIGAWRKEADGTIYGGYYTQKDIKEIVDYAKSRFINVVPEIEMPGHCAASLAAYPQNSCTGGLVLAKAQAEASPFEVPITWGVFKDVYCAGSDSTFYFLQDILDEVIQLFPGKYIHIGGDEVPKDRWKECQRCQARIKAEGLKDEQELQSYFIKRISNYIHSKGKEVIGWDEILQGGLAPGAIVQSWQGFQGAVDAAKLGHYTICSPASYTYLDSEPEDIDLRIAYSFEPIPKDLLKNEIKFILGGEACLWTERALREFIDGKLFPRLLALSEVFWSDPQNRNFEEFHSRVEQTYDDLTALGIKYGAESKAVDFSTSYNEQKKQFSVTVSCQQKDLVIHYTENGNAPDLSSAVYSEPIKIDKTAKLKIAVFRDNHFIGKQINLDFDFHKALNAEITLFNKYDERYRAGGANALIDGIRGTDDFHDGLWQGYEGEDFSGIIDLGKEKGIFKVTPRFLFNANSWIFLPIDVRISLSSDGVKYFGEKIISNDIPQKSSEIVLKDFQANFSGQKARYIKVIAESIKKCPAWHPGAGGKAWLFIDEIVVE